MLCLGLCKLLYRPYKFKYCGNSLCVGVQLFVLQDVFDGISSSIIVGQHSVNCHSELNRTLRSSFFHTLLLLYVGKRSLIKLLLFSVCILDYSCCIHFLLFSVCNRLDFVIYWRRQQHVLMRSLVFFIICSLTHFLTRSLTYHAVTFLLRLQLHGRMCRHFSPFRTGK